MKKILYLLILLAVIACAKKDNEEEPAILPLDVLYSFDDASALDAWNITTPNEALVIIDNQDKVAGTGSMKVYSGCCVLELKSGIPLKLNTEYGLTINGKRTPYGPNDTVCAWAYSLGLFVIQGDQEIFGKSFGNSPNWKTEGFYFNSHESADPVTLRIMVNTKEAWVDELRFEEL